MNDEPYVIAILDEEDTERDSFHNYFDNFGFTCFEDLHMSSNINDLIETIRTEKIDAIAIDYKLMDHGSSFGFNGDYFFHELNKVLLNYPSFILTNDPDDAKKQSSKINPFFILGKERLSLDNPSLSEEIRTIIRNYKESINDYLTKLSTLEEVRKKDGLSSDEEERYVELNNILDKTVDQQSLLPRTFYSNETNSKLDEILEKTEALLGKVSQKDV
jgi:hypothetical protein